MPSKITMCVLVTVGLVAAGCYEQPGCSDCETDGEDADVAEWQDTDGDTIRDGDEGRAGERDTDSDGTPDYLDLDADGDGVPDADEAGDEDLMTSPVDSDADDTPDFMDPDSDSNGIDDGEEDLHRSIGNRPYFLAEKPIVKIGNLHVFSAVHIDAHSEENHPIGTEDHHPRDPHERIVEYKS